MEGVYKIGYLLLMGILVFNMFRRGGCCGHGHGHSGERHSGDKPDGNHDHGSSV